MKQIEWSPVEWLEDITERGVRERGFSLICDERVVPGVLWAPADRPARGLVLLGHGGGVHKRAMGMPGQARSLVRHEGIAAVAIDAVGHGDRVRDGNEEAAAIAQLEEQGPVDMRSAEFLAIRRRREPIDRAAFDV
jgi:hypothetical protein